MVKRKMKKSVCSDSHRSERKTSHASCSNSDSSDEEVIRLPKRRKVNRIISSDSDTDTDKCNLSDNECYEDTIDEILRDLVVEERSNVDDTEEVAIQQSEWSEFSGRQK